MVGNRLHLAEIVGADAAHQRTSRTIADALRQNLALDQRDCHGDALDARELGRQLRIVVERPVDRLDDHVTVDAENARDQLGAEPVHHGHDDDQRRDAEHDADEGEAGDNRNEGFLAPGTQVAPRHHALKGGKGTAGGLFRLRCGLHLIFSHGGHPAFPRLFTSLRSAC
ncbi:hypothetical protein D9M72_481610 [compost metagenome]